jgi:hypothetical protein
VVIDDDVHNEPSRKIGLVESYLGGKLGVAAGIFYRVAQQGSEPAPTGRNDEQCLAQVRDLDEPPSLRFQRRLASAGSAIWPRSETRNSAMLTNPIRPATRRGEKDAHLKATSGRPVVEPAVDVGNHIDASLGVVDLYAP